jgi:hypothetical protein
MKYLLDPKVQPLPDDLECKAPRAKGCGEHIRYYTIVLTDLVLRKYAKTMSILEDRECCRQMRLGVLIPFDQDWVDKGRSRGRLVSSVFVPPRGEVEVSERNWQTQRSEKSVTVQLDASFSRSIDSSRSDSSSVANRTSFSKSRSKSCTFGGSIGLSLGPISLSRSISGTIATAQSLERVSDTAKELIQTQTEHAAWEERRSRVSSVTVSQETGAEKTVTRKFQNPSLSKGVSYDFYEVLQNYDVYTHELGAIKVILVPRPLPKIDAEWLRCHEWILKAVLRLDNAADLFDEIRWTSTVPRPYVPDIVDELPTFPKSSIDSALIILTFLYEFTSVICMSLPNVGVMRPSPQIVEDLRQIVKSGDTSETKLSLGGVLLAGLSWSAGPFTVFGLFQEELQKKINEYKLIYESYCEYKTALAAAKVKATEEEKKRLEKEQELLSPWLENKNRMDRAVSILRCHIEEHLSHYLNIIWAAESPEDRACQIRKLYPDLLPEFWSIVRNELITVIGNCMVMPLELEWKSMGAKSFGISDEVIPKLRKTLSLARDLITEAVLVEGEKVANRLESKDRKALVSVTEWTDRLLSELKKIESGTPDKTPEIEKLRLAVVDLYSAIRSASIDRGAPLSNLFKAMIVPAKKKLDAQISQLEQIQGKIQKKAEKSKVGLAAVAAEIQQQINLLKSISYDFDVKSFTSLEEQCLNIENSALMFDREKSYCVFVQLPTPALCVEPRLTNCDAWSEDVKRDWENSNLKSKLENKLLELKRHRHEMRLNQSQLDNPDCCPESNFRIRIERTDTGEE